MWGNKNARCGNKFPFETLALHNTHVRANFNFKERGIWGTGPGPSFQERHPPPNFTSTSLCKF